MSHKDRKAKIVHSQADEIIVGVVNGKLVLQGINEKAALEKIHDEDLIEGVLCHLVAISRPLMESEAAFVEEHLQIVVEGQIAPNGTFLPVWFRCRRSQNIGWLVEMIGNEDGYGIYFT